MRFERRFPFIPRKEGIYCIRGPRQIGKSSWVKTILKSYPRPKDAFYYSCEDVADYKELAEILKIAGERTLICLDEISFIRDWDRAIKKFVDQTTGKILVITGSSAHDLRRGMDRMPGRWGAGGEVHLLPMEFAEFKATRHEKNWSSGGDLAELETYFRIGGFPTALNEYMETGGLPKNSIGIQERWLLGDAAKLHKNEQYLREIVIQLAETMGAPISLQKLAQRTQIGSHHTALDYVNLLEDCFALNTLYCVDANTGSFRYKKEKKFYFSDPLLYWMALGWKGVSLPDQEREYVTHFEKIAEAVACRHLKKDFKRLGYYHSSKGEIDFFEKGKLAVEVKWSFSARALSRAYKDMIIPNKIVWTKNNFLKFIPASRSS